MLSTERKNEIREKVTEIVRKNYAYNGVLHDDVILALISDPTAGPVASSVIDFHNTIDDIAEFYQIHFDDDIIHQVETFGQLVNVTTDVIDVNQPNKPTLH